LLAAVRPKLAVIPVGRNSYGHPSPDTLERLERYSVPVYRTDILGHITVHGG
jgi:competence protein ComEC